MIGSNGPRVLGIALPHADAWNTWWEDYGNSVDGFAALTERISAAARDAGRAPEEIERSACVLVALDRAAGERPAARGAAGRGPPERIAAHLRELAEAGADEAILVADPITERSIRDLAEAVALRPDVAEGRPRRPPRSCVRELALGGLDHAGAVLVRPLVLARGARTALVRLRQRAAQLVDRELVVARPRLARAQRGDPVEHRGAVVVPALVDLDPAQLDLGELGQPRDDLVRVELA